MLARRAPRGVQPGKANGEGLLLEAQDHGVTTVHRQTTTENGLAKVRAVRSITAQLHLIQHICASLVLKRPFELTTQVL